MPMPPSRTRFAVAAWALFLTLHSQPATAAPIVFDFEDQTSQGWTLRNAFLHPTLGVFSEVSEGLEWAIFGLDGSIISMTLDLTNIARLTWEEFVPSGGSFAFIVVRPGNTPPFDPLGLGVPLSPLNPRERFFDLSMLTGIHRIDIGWLELFPPPGEEFPAPTLFATGFINTITFHLVPEPSGLTLFGLLALVGLLGLQRRLEVGARQRGSLLVIPVAMVLVCASTARGAPIVFDFEDQTAQGWTLQNAFLHRTVGVFSDGVDWTIFGLDGSLMEMTMDLTNVANMTWEEFDPSTTSTSGFAGVVVAPGNTPPFDPLGLGVPLSSMNPRERFFDLSMLTGTHTLLIGWDQRFPSPGEEFPEPTLFNTGFINTITFHPVPEPSTLALLAFGLAALAIARPVGTSL